MSGEMALELFYKEELSICIKGASADEMRMLQNILGLRWRSHDDLDSKKFLAHCDYDAYLHDNKPSLLELTIDRLSISVGEKFGWKQMTVSEFLDLFKNLDIKESELVKLFGE